MRANNDAVLVGINTIDRDDPAMTTDTTRQARPVILDSDLRIPLTAKVLRHPKAPWIFTQIGNEDKARKRVHGATVIDNYSSSLKGTGRVGRKSVLREIA